VRKGDEILMIHRFRDGNEYYVLPGGGVELGESPEVTALRELKEETSIIGKIDRKISDIKDNNGNIHQIFLLEYISGEATLPKNSEEAKYSTKDNTYEPCWVKVVDIDRLTMWPEGTKELIKDKCSHINLSNDEIIRLAKIIWNYHLLNQKLEKADGILVLGSSDIRIAERGAELYLDHWAPLIIFSGGLGRMTKHTFAKSEAEVFADVAIKMGVPKDKIILETKSTNTGDNILFSRQLLLERNIAVRKLIAVTKPYMERRALATIKKLWPELDFIVTSSQISFEYFPTEARPMDYIVNAIVADIQRIMIYPKKGFQIEQHIPDEVLDAYKKLIEAGYTKQLIRE
jgi:uncharacterized SAM-binding protein YcdF (DUF218 family)/8-oxo-dGTP pyrophosphatase MutT (NUDIX family)